MALNLCVGLIGYEEVREFREWIIKGYRSSISDAQNMKKMLEDLNSYLSIRSTVLAHKITMADLFLVSGLKRNEKFTITMQAQYPHINRWVEWVQNLLGVEYYTCFSA